MPERVAYKCYLFISVSRLCNHKAVYPVEHIYVDTVVAGVAKGDEIPRFIGTPIATEYDVVDG